MSTKNIAAIVVIIAVVVVGALAIYKMDNGQGDRTSATIAAKSASD